MCLGDIAYPFYGSVRLEVGDRFANAVSVGNLEGPIGVGDCAPRDRYKYSLYSSSALFDLAAQFGLGAVSLANNHVEDWAGGLDRSLSLLDRHGIRYFGLREQPWTRIEVDGVDHVILGMCAAVTEPLSAGGRRVNLLDPQGSLTALSRLRREFPASRLVAMPHWGYELSRYPQPADREWARAAIEAGADAVVGHHPHTVQGVEIHQGRPIAYSLGNWLLPQVNYAGKRLSYKGTDSFEQLVLELGAGEPVAHFFGYDPEQRLISWAASAPAAACDRIRELTPYAGMSDAEYRRFFASLPAGRGTPKGYPTFWTYFGPGRWTAKAKLGAIRARKTVRRLAMWGGLHKPYAARSPQDTFRSSQHSSTER